MKKGGGGGFQKNQSIDAHFPTHSSPSTLRLDPAFRIAYARLWDALLAGDVPAILASARDMRAGDAGPLFASMLTLKPWRAISDPGAGTKAYGRLAAEAGDADEAREYAADHAADINALLGRLPRELLLLLKTNDNLRSIDRSLGEVRR